MNNNQIKLGLRKIVNPVGLLVAQKGDKRDATTVAWMSKVSNHPPLIMVSIAPERYVYHLIKETGEFVLALLTDRQESLALYCGSTTAYDVDKFHEAKIETEEALFLKVPLIKDTVVNLECRVKDLYPAGDHVMVIGEVLAAHHDGEDRKPLIMTDKMGTIEF